MSQYNTGTVAVTNGSATVTGTGTLFSANVTAGDFFTVVSDNAFYTVGSVDSDTQLTLAANYAGVTGSGKAYTMVKDFTTNLGFPVPNQGDIETALVVARAIEEIDSELNTAGIGGDGREWVDLKDSPTYVNATQFTVATDKTANYHVDRRIRATDSSTIYGRISASSFAASVTTVTVVWDSGSLSASLSALALGIGTANSQFPITGSAVKGGTPLLDTIDEATSAAGVTIDGVLHKDGLVSTGTPTASSHATSKSYVDALVVSGVFWKQPVRCATTANLDLIGEETIDGVTTATDRVLVKDQSTGSENGIYVTASGAWSRSTDADADAEVVGGLAVRVSEGTLNGNKAFTLTTDDPIVVGTTALTFAEFGGGDLLPVVDTKSIVEDPGDPTKEMRIDVGVVSPATVRVLTMPDQDIDLTPGTGSFATEAEGTLAAAALPKGGGTMTGAVDAGDQTFSRINLKDYGEVTNAIGSIGGGTQDIDLTLGNVITATIDTSTTTFTFSNPTASDEGCSFTLILTDGGSQTVIWPGSVTWVTNGGADPILKATGLSIVSFLTLDGGTTWFGWGTGESAQSIHSTHAKLGATAGWVVDAADDLGLLATLPTSVSPAGTLVVPIAGLNVGDTITAFSVVGQIESAGGAVTLDADLRKHTAAAADVTDASVGAITTISRTADYAINDAKTGLAEVITADETFYVLLTGATAASTDIALQGVTITVTKV